MKVLDVKNLNANIDQTIEEIHNFQNQITTIQKAVRNVASLDDSLKGKTGDAIRSFYNEAHQPFLIYMYDFLQQFEQKLNQMKQAIQSFEPDPNGFVRLDFLETEVNQGLQKVKDVTIDLTDEANATMNRVRDIVVLPQLDPNELVHYVDRGKANTRNVIEQLQALDKSQTSALSSLNHELNTMKSYISDMEGKFHSGYLSIANYSLNSVQGISAYSSILDSVYNQSNAAAGNGDNTVTSNKQKPNIQAESQSAVYLDPTAPFDSTADLYSRGTETIAFTSTANNVRKGLAIDKMNGREIKYKVNNPHLIGINSSNKGRNYKTYSRSYIESELNRGNNPKVAQYVNAGSGATQALKSKAGWFGVALSTGSNMYKNIKSDVSTSKIIGDAGVDVGLGAVSLAAGGVVMSGLVGAFGAPLLVAGAISLGLSSTLSFFFDGLTFGKGKNKKSVSDHIKSGVQSVAGWVKGIFK